jgi:hypothetical protein
MMKSRTRWKRICRERGSREKYRISPEGKPGGERLLGRLRLGWVDIINMHLGETEWSCMEWIDLAQDKKQWKAPR